MKKVVFICHGNMFRSPIAKAFYNQLAKDGSSAESYGTHVIAQGYQGRKLSSFLPLKMEFDELEKFGLDITNEHCEQLKEEYLKDADKIIVIAEREYIPGWLEKYKYEYWEGVPNDEFPTNEMILGVIKLIREKVVNLIK